MSMTLEQAIRILHPETYPPDRAATIQDYIEANGLKFQAERACKHDATLLACEVMQREVERGKGCEHCCAGEELGYGRDSLGRSAYLYLDGNLLIADLYSDSMAVAIQFCPMCGRKLNDGKVDGDE